MIARLAGCICVAALLTAAPAAQVDSAGLNAQSTVRALAVLGPRAAGSATERRAAAVVMARFAKLGLTPVVQAVPLPRGGASRNLVFRTGAGLCGRSWSPTSTASRPAPPRTTTARGSARC